MKASQIGTARLLAKALTNEESDALEITFPVEPSGVPLRSVELARLRGYGSGGYCRLTFPANTDAAAHESACRGESFDCGKHLPGARLSDELSVWMHGADDVELPAECDCGRDIEEAERDGRVDQADLNAKVQAGMDRLEDLPAR